VEGGGIRPEEPPTDVWDAGLPALLQSATMTRCEGECELGRHDSVLAGKPVDEGSIAGIAGERTPGGAAREQRLTKDFVGEETIVSEQRE
jgi:hypothetical protein